MSPILLVLSLVSLSQGFTSSGVPCYLRSAADECHYRQKPYSDACTSAADKTKLSKRMLQFNRTLVSLEQQLIRLGVIPPDNACSELPPLVNGGIIYTDLNLAPGSIGRYICNEGYTLITLYGHKEFTCTEDGVWDGNVTEVPALCQLATGSCDPPEEILNGTVRFEDDNPANVLTGDKITYYCEPGSELQDGVSGRYCLRTGNWSGTEPICIPSEVIRNNSDPVNVFIQENHTTEIGIGVGVGSAILLVVVLLIVIPVTVKLGRPAFKRWKEGKYSNLNSGDNSESRSTPYVSFSAAKKLVLSNPEKISSTVKGNEFETSI